MKLPLGFLAAFFGMNNSAATGSDWMTLNQQVQYMCKRGPQPFSRCSLPVRSSVSAAVPGGESLSHRRKELTWDAAVGISSFVVAISMSLAFSQTARAAFSVAMIPLIVAAEYLGLLRLWRTCSDLLSNTSRSSRGWRQSTRARREARMLEKRTGAFEAAVNNTPRERTSRFAVKATGSWRSGGQILSPADGVTGVRQGESQSFSGFASRARNLRRLRKPQPATDVV
jgi:hypothetical protein